MEKEKCPACNSDKYVVSIFGSICSECFYQPTDYEIGLDSESI